MSMYKQGLIILGIFTILISASYSADKSKFKIQQYKPDKFVDLMWMAEGEISLDGHNLNDEDIRPGYYYYKSTYDRSYSNFNLMGRSNLSYTSESIEQFFNSSVFVYSGLGLSSNNSERYRYDSTMSEYKTYYMSDSETRRYSFELRPSVKTGKYLAGDFFASVFFRPGFYYSRTPVNESEAVSERTQMIVDNEAQQYRDYIQDNERQLNKGGNDRKRSYGELELLPGFGRIYEGSYASTAIYMIDELRDKNVLIREPSEDEMLELCEIIYKNRLQHTVDKRIRRIEVFDEILSYLNSINVTDLSGHMPYLYIQDVWDYFPRYRRAFGTKFSFGGGIDFTRESRQSTVDSEDSRLVSEYRQTYSGDITMLDTLVDEERIVYDYSYQSSESKDLYLTVMVEHYKPISNKWQLNYTGTIDYSLDRYEIDDNASTHSFTTSDGYSYQSKNTSRSERDYSLNYRFSSNLHLVYLVDSRTSFNFRNGVAFDKSRFHIKEFNLILPDDEFDYNSRGFSIQFMSSFNYRINIPTELILGASYRIYDNETWNDQNIDDYKNNNYDVSISIRHYIY